MQALSDTHITPLNKYVTIDFGCDMNISLISEPGVKNVESLLYFTPLDIFCTP
jgi:hypothetical protein